MQIRLSPDAGIDRGGIARWGLLLLLVAGASVGVCWHLFGHAGYRIDIDVYQMGAQAWLDGRPLYTHGVGANARDVMFHTPIGLDLPFTYPPLAAVAFSPFAWLHMPAASTAITALTLLLLLTSTMIVLTRLQVWSDSVQLPGAAWLRRLCATVLIVAPASMWMEPIAANFAFGQINVVLMTLVIADCVPVRSRWPRGMLLGLGIALKLTPAVFLLYFVMRRDVRSTVTSLVSFGVATLLGFALAWNDSWEYWTHTVHHTDRIGSAALNTDQNIAGALARLNIAAEPQFVLWAIASTAVLALTVWAIWQVLRAGESIVAIICVALFGLMVSPVSWSHHWVWVLPAVLVTGILGWRGRTDARAALGVLAAIGVVITRWSPLNLLPAHHEVGVVWWRQLAGMSYVWWALAVLITCAVVYRNQTGLRPSPADSPVPVSA